MHIFGNEKITRFNGIKLAFLGKTHCVRQSSCKMFCKLNSGYLIQILAAFSGSFSILSSGINLGWTSPYLPDLQSEDSPIPTTNEEGLWCAVMALLGAPVGALYAAIFTDRIGRKLTTLSMAPIMAISFIAIGYATSIIHISIARFFIGAVEGGLYTVLPIYIAEISHQKIRGFLTSTIDLATITGTLFINAIGPYTSILTSSWICTCVPVIHIISFSFMPESPYYHIKKGKFDEAKQSLIKLRGCKDVEQELCELTQAVKRQESNKKGTISDIFAVKSNRKAALIFMLLSTSNKFSGNNPMLFYTSTIFANAQTNIDPSLSVIIYCIVRLFGTIFALFLVDKFGRRPLMLISSFGCFFSLFFEGLFFYLQSYFPFLAESVKWLPIVGLLSYNVFFSVGLSYGPIMLLGELFPTNIKALALGLGDSFSVVMGTLASKYFQATMDEFGLHVPFWTFSLCCLAAMILIFKFLPETKGKTLEQIQQYLIQGKWQ